MLNRILKNLRKKKIPSKNDKPVKGLYVVLEGYYGGSYIIYSCTIGKTHQFFTMDDKYDEIMIPDDAFKEGIDNNILELVEKLPEDVYDTCIQQCLHGQNKKKSSKIDK